MNFRPFAPTLLLLSLLPACADEHVDSVTSPVVYDADDRIEVFEEKDPAWRSLAERSIVALVRKADIFHTGNTYTVPDFSQDDYVMSDSGLPMCDDQLYRTQPSLSTCSGTLIDDDLVLTAGHCFEDADPDCSDYYYVFDFFYTSDGTLAQIDEADVFQCDRIVARELQAGSPYIDYAIVKLSRRVGKDRSPAPIDATDDVLPRGTPITVMGFPIGIPLKIDHGGEIINTTTMTPTVFVGTPDTFAGNSGCGVFSDDGRLVGILNSGQDDYVERVDSSCMEVNVLDPEVDAPVGERMTYVHRAISALCLSEDATRNVCGRGGGCGVGTHGQTSDEAHLGALVLAVASVTLARRRRSIGVGIRSPGQTP